jgi:hypothetical protein
MLQISGRLELSLVSKEGFRKFDSQTSSVDKFMTYFEKFVCDISIN